jgi:hypothetical protein
MVVHELKLKIPDYPNGGNQHEALIYFYCKRDEPNRQDPTKVMQALVKQLSLQLVNNKLPALIVNEYYRREQNGFASRYLDFEDCQKFLISLLNLYPQTTVVLDALDEVDKKTRKQLLNSLTAISEGSSSLVKIFCSSRDDRDITRVLEGMPNVYIKAQDNSRDIERFVIEEIDRKIQDGELLNGIVEEDLKSRIIKTLCDKADGM